MVLTLRAGTSLTTISMELSRQSMPAYKSCKFSCTTVCFMLVSGRIVADAVSVQFVCAEYGAKHDNSFFVLHLMTKY